MTYDKDLLYYYTVKNQNIQNNDKKLEYTDVVINNGMKLQSIQDVSGRGGGRFVKMMRVQMTRFTEEGEFTFDLQDDGDKSLKAIDMIEDYQNNCYYSYVVKSGIEAGVLFINET